MKLKINEVIADVKDELLCYEEGEAVVDRWEKEFREWIEKNKDKHKDIVADKNAMHRSRLTSSVSSKCSCGIHG